MIFAKWYCIIAKCDLSLINLDTVGLLHIWLRKLLFNISILNENII